ncbi:MAG: hypothetical protein P9X22_04700 [Candidatus Zapsychrus exili]|nr:hypothetical protein [Candidatus Zapsychrus exili]
MRVLLVMSDKNKGSLKVMVSLDKGKHIRQIITLLSQDKKEEAFEVTKRYGAFERYISPESFEASDQHELTLTGCLS